MKPDSPAFENDDDVQPSPSSAINPAINLVINPATASELSSSTSTPSSLNVLGPLENLQRRYSDQLSEDIERLEAEKAKLQVEIAALKRDYAQLQSDRWQQRSVGESIGQGMSADAHQLDKEFLLKDAVTDETAETAETAVTDETAIASQPQTPLPVQIPLLPGERAMPTNMPTKTASTALAPAEAVSTTTGLTSTRGMIALPIPATSEQRRQRNLERLQQQVPKTVATPRKGLILSAIAAVLMAWHFCVVGALGQGGSWLGIPIEQLGTGFVPGVALLWLRMLVMVPALGMLAPQLYRHTWEDLQDWIYDRDRLLLLLIGSGVALFFSEVLIYQCIGLAGPVIGAMLLFLYPLTAVPLGALTSADQKLSPLGGLALVAIAMGATLALKPTLGNTLANAVRAANNTASYAIAPSTIWPGILASIAFSLYVVLTNLSYRQQHCHPMPVGIVQFSTVSVLSSLVLLVRPLKPVEIDWLSFALWGILLGFIMLLVYLFSYSSLRMIGSRTATVAAATPFAAMLLAWSFTPLPLLGLLQWTGILLVTIGGIAFGQEKTQSP